MFLALLDLFFPPRCVACLAYIRGEHALCEECREKLVFEKSLFCGECRKRVPPLATKALCHPSSLYLLGAALRYTDPIPNALIRTLKFEHVRAAARELGDALCAYLSTANCVLPTANCLVVPVPLGKRRERERGYNQAELIALEVAQSAGLPLRNDVLRRIKNTKPQSEARDMRVRKANVAGSFSADPKKLVGVRTVVLIDDVVTSGATLEAAALALKRASDVRIVALAAAHA